MPTTAKTHATTKTGSHGGKQDAIAVLKADHDKVTELFSQFEEAHGSAKKRKLANEICAALTAHAQVEEELFYPEAQKAMKDKELIPEAAVEHGVIKDLVEQIQGDEEGGEMFEARVKVLSEYVRHHIKEEQGEIFKKLKETGLDLHEMGVRIAERLEDLRSAKH